MNRLVVGWLTRAGLLLLVLIVTGCAAAETQRVADPGTTDLRIQRIEFRGVENVSERDLRAGLALQEDPGWRARVERLPIVGLPPSYFNPFHWRRDRERIIAFYHQRGFFDAAIVSESVIEDRESGTVRIRVTIEEGEPTRIRRVEVQGLIPGETPAAASLLRGLAVEEGDIFREQDYLTSRSLLSNRLRQAGHAYAVVTGRVFVDPDERIADVFFFTDPGPRARIGEAHIFGLEEIPEHRVRAALPFREGAPYSPSLLQETQNELYDLGVFGLVTVLPAHEAREFNVESDSERRRLEEILDTLDVPDPEDVEAQDSSPPDELADDIALGVSAILHDAQSRAEARTRLDPNVPLVIRLQEAKKYSVRVGAGVAVESTRQDVRGLANWSARNFLGGLRRLDHRNMVGYAFAPTVFSDVNRGVILSSELAFQQPQFIDRRTNLRLRGQVQRDVREGFSVWNPSFRISVDRPIWQHLVADVGYNVAFYSYFNIQPSLLNPPSTALGLDFQEQFLLEHLEQTLAWDTRSDVLNPRSGYYVGVTFQQAGRYLLGGEFDFLKPLLSAELYLPTNRLPTPTVLALRSRLGAVYNVGRDTGVPVQSRLYSGGTDGMRGFGRRRLSLYTPSGDEAVPVGGLTQAEASVEPRFRLLTNLLGIGDVWGALFVDGATVLGEQLVFDTAAHGRGTVEPSDLFTTLLYAAGLGAWWNTPVGPVRLDFAYTLSDYRSDGRFRRCVDEATYNTDQCVFIDPDDDPILDLLPRYSFYLSIGHSF